jgi:hypothetical protein
MKKIFGRNKKAVFLPWAKRGPAQIQKAMKALDGLLGTPDIQLTGSKFLTGELLEWSDKIHDPYLHENLESVLKKENGGVCASHYIKNGEDLYFLANLAARELKFQGTFRSRLPNVEFRYPGTGRVESAEVLRTGGETTSVAIVLPPLESVIVVLKRNPAQLDLFSNSGPGGAS